MDPRFQPRESLHRSTVVKYLWDMRRGDVFPPITLGRVSGQLVLLDGFHRVQAAREAGLPRINAEVATMNAGFATQFAIAANVNHGRVLTQADKRRSFQIYKEAGLHLHPEGSPKSLRTICRDLANMVVPNTIRNWLRQNDMEVVEEEDLSGRKWDEGPEVLDPVRLEDFDEQLHVLERIVHGIEAEDHRCLAVRRLRELVYRLAEPTDPLAV